MVNETPTPFFEQLDAEQYSWSMMMGNLTSFMIRFWKSMADAALGGDPGHVLILIPLSVPVKVQSLTVMPLTSCSLGYLPRLPTLSSCT